jgi:hypothetical protein
MAIFKTWLLLSMLTFVSAYRPSEGPGFTVTTGGTTFYAEANNPDC